MVNAKKFLYKLKRYCFKHKMIDRVDPITCKLNHVLNQVKFHINKPFRMRYVV